MEGRPNRSNKATFSNSSDLNSVFGLVWTVDEAAFSNFSGEVWTDGAQHQPQGRL